MSTLTLRCELAFESYIAHPYWPERETVIRIVTDSGMNRQKSDDKRIAALKGELEKRALTMAQFEELKRRANRSWYRVDDADEGQIIIPRHQLAGCLVQTVGTTPKAVRGRYEKDSFRHEVRLGDFTTGKYTCDDVFRRYVRLNPNVPRNLQENEVIRDFTAAGAVVIVADAKIEELKRLVAYAVRNTGVGAARKMGFGRAELKLFAEV
jgi:hypothetical protein